ncbi:hypothetical protein JN12_03583 [Geobacter argillaceus]|uniref:Uncharacterized protein n=1 Tax=Geobacter argillaceus TaxID=345631 RepID=A0A562V843_9BACT|nr:hypothetical protein JN12_03583 [Geobacter argillaceus]
MALDMTIVTCVGVYGLVPWNIILFVADFVGWVRRVYAVTQHDQAGNMQDCWVTR